MERQPASVIIPAHNESRTIGRLLRAIDRESHDELDVIVVCNGCTDDTASQARAFAGVRVFEIEMPSKAAAQSEGDARALHPTRAYVDADVSISGDDLRRLVWALSRENLLAVAPERVLDTSHSSFLVVRYYEIWQRLPQVSAGLFGRGVVVLSSAGRSRMANAPRVMSDDLLMSEMFTSSEREVVPGTTVYVRAPGAVADLLRRRVRVATGNVEMDQNGLRTTGARTSLGTLLRLAATSPQLAVDVAVFLIFTVVARVLASRRVRAGDFQTWLRDESSRSS